jgi:tripartite-type tricarboxylate transporter receptor subunit TctC
MRRTLLRALALSPLATALPAWAQAGGYPNKPIRLIVPFATGGIADTFARAISQRLNEVWGQPVVVENRTGAGGNIGADLVAKAAPDGYTILMTNIGTHAVNVHLFKSMPFDPVKDFVPIAHVLDAEGLLVVHPDVKANNVSELIALARAQPGKLSYASGGMGTTSHLAGELFKSMAKVEITHVPYKGNVPAIMDVLGGQVQMAFATMPTVLPHVRAGKLRSLAVIGGTRAAALPDVPTVSESGLPGFEVSNWIGLFAPAGTPMDIVNRIHGEVQKLMRTPEMGKRLETEGAKFFPMSQAQFAEFQRNELARWGKIIREAGIKAD